MQIKPKLNASIAAISHGKEILKFFFLVDKIKRFNDICSCHKSQKNQVYINNHPMIPEVSTDNYYSL